MSAEPQAVTAVSDGPTLSYLTRLTAVYVSSGVLYLVVIGCDFLLETFTNLTAESCGGSGIFWREINKISDGRGAYWRETDKDWKLRRARRIVARNNG